MTVYGLPITDYGSLTTALNMDWSSTAPADRVLVIKLSSLGDLFHALPVVHVIRESLNVTVDWVTQPEYEDLVRCFNDVDDVIVFPRRDFFRQGLAFFHALRRRRYQLALDLQGLLKSALVLCLARGARKIGPSFAREGTRALYPELAGPRNKDRHAVVELFDLLDYLGLPRPTRPVFPVSFARFPLNIPAPRIALIPCSRWATKNLPPERFAAAAAAISRPTGATFFIVGAPADRPAADIIARTLGEKARNYCGQTSLLELGSLLQEMDLVITVDSGPMHMAAALGKPVLAVFGPTNPARTGPYGPAQRVIQLRQPECIPCHARECRRHDHACMAGIDADTIAMTALEMLNHNR